MKKFIYIFFAIITSSIASAQEFPLNYGGDTPDDAYYKDFDGELNKYVGVCLEGNLEWEDNLS